MACDELADGHDPVAGARRPVAVPLSVDGDEVGRTAARAVFELDLSDSHAATA
jgi:hypothetical protein